MSGYELSDLLLTDPTVTTSVGRTLVFRSGRLTAWDPATYANTVREDEGGVWTDLPVINPGELSIGRVLLASTPAGPVVLGRIYQAT